MKKLAPFIVLLLLVCAWLYRGNQLSPPLRVSRVIVISYYSKNCADCNDMEHTIRKLGWFFGREPVEFLVYAPHDASLFSKTKASLQQKGLWQLVFQNYKAGTAGIYSLKTKQLSASLNHNSSLTEAEQCIKAALK
jgi:hypothetical protein